MDIDSKWLEDLLALASCRSFSQAAARRHVTQPAFSRRIRALEDAVGAALIDRSKTPVDLTSEGQLFLLTARSVTDQLAEAVARVRGLQPAQAQVLDIAAAHSLANSFFPDWLSQLPLGSQQSIRLAALNVEEAVHQLREGQCDMMLVYYDPLSALQLDSATFPSLPLASTALVPVCAPGENGQPRWNLETDETVPLLAYTQGAFLGRTLRMMLANDSLRLRLRTLFETAMADGLKGMALKGLGVAWLPRLCIEQELADGRLLELGPARYQAPLEIRLYRCTLVHKAALDRLWQQLAAT
ncbi:LysR substrate-binding domain-containing protein [Gallaecimonas pentaromativorans]|uniref:LysR substrate-binding domain-containing protein n=1 Tax=Gallaecimonas pentaromativorans TaxID=584787 RepID=UPI00067EECD0|nr:LysR substrate-binding domain-containing protein [Gallaecimonas pentaromativorans]MED5524303.1 LysR substrate-binding domain-containing protein [Pseudomonadota bacterium]